MKLSDYAKLKSISYRTAHRHWKQGLIPGEQLPTGTIVVYKESASITSFPQSPKVALYARVSSTENKSNLERQLQRIRDYAAAKGYQVVAEVKEIGSGLNDQRKKLQGLLQSDKWDILLVEHKDRLARFGTGYLRVLLTQMGKEIEIINQVQTDKEDLMQDFVSIVTSFVARLYGLRRSKRKTEQLIEALKNDATG